MVTMESESQSEAAMLVNRVFTKYDTLVEKTLDSLATRLEAQANNVSNINTPGYNRQVVDFEDALAEAYEAAPRYLPHTPAGEMPVALQMYAPRTTEERDVQRLDGNTITPEKEMSEMVQTAIAYNLMVRKAGWSTLKQIIQSSK